MEAVNPYESPKSNTLNSSSETYKPKFISVHGRIGRLRYLAYSMTALFLCGIVIGIPAAILIPNMASDSSGMLFIVLALVAYIPLLVYSVLIAKRRFNDLNHSGWWQLLLYIPYIGIIPAIYMLFWPGTKGSNNYGPSPEKNSGLLIVAGFVLPLFIVAILAAIAIPAYQDYVLRAQQAMEMQQ